MKAARFSYPDEQWRNIELIVARSGGDDTKKKLNGSRKELECGVSRWLSCVESWDGASFGHDDRPQYSRIEDAAKELVAALDELSFPAIFAGDDLVWRAGDAPEENAARYAAFVDALQHVGARAGQMGQAAQGEE